MTAWNTYSEYKDEKENCVALYRSYSSKKYNLILFVFCFIFCFFLYNLSKYRISLLFIKTYFGIDSKMYLNKISQNFFLKNKIFQELFKAMKLNVCVAFVVTIMVHFTAFFRYIICEEKKGACKCLKEKVFNCVFSH